MRRVVAILCSLALLVLSGCGSVTQPTATTPSAPEKPAAAGSGAPAASPVAVPGVNADTVTFGSWGPITGPAAAWGPAVTAIGVYFDYVNEKEGGIHGRKLKLVIEDDQYQPSKTVAAVKKMVEQDQVFAFVGGVGTATGSAVMDDLVKEQIPVVAPGTGSGKWSIPLKKNYFAWYFSYRSEAIILTRYAVDTLGKKQLAVFYQNDDFGREGLQGVKDTVTDAGGTLVAEVSYNPSDSDLSAQALKLKQSGAEAVLSWPTVKHAAALINEAASIGYHPTWLFTNPVAEPSLVTLTNGDAEGAYFAASLPSVEDTDNPVVREWREVVGKAGLNPTNMALIGWANARVAVEGLRRAGPNLTRDSYIKALETMKDWNDVARVSYTPEDHRGVSVGWVTQLQNGKFVKVSDYLKAE